jgi:competence ComEA-like helix-hairpin-helix protein
MTATTQPPAQAVTDPLQDQATPYEVLGVGPDASDEEIHSALGRLLGGGGDVRRLTAARQALRRPVDRAVLDALQYSSHRLARLTPSPLDDRALLLPPARADTAATWEHDLRDAFPDTAALHCLAVLWYWSAVHTAADDSAAATSVGMWERAVGFWVAALAAEDFWTSWPRVTADIAQEASARLLDDLRHRIDELADACRRRGEPAADSFTQLELALSIEQQAAELFAVADASTPHGALRCGPVLLRVLDLHEILRPTIDAVVSRAGGDARLAPLRDLLSPLAGVAALLERGRPHEVVTAIDALAPDVRFTDDAVNLRARALVALGNEALSLRRPDDALTAWQDAVGSARGGTRDVVSRDVVLACQQHAGSVAAHHLEDAIGFLDQAVGIVDDDRLRLSLADLLLRRGTTIANDAQTAAAAAGKPNVKALRSAFTTALRDLERAAELGSAAAAREAETLRDALEQLKGGMLGLPAAVAKPLARASAAAEKGRWDDAVSALRQAHDAAEGEARDTIRSNLAVAVLNRGMEAANKAGDRLQTAQWLSGAKSVTVDEAYASLSGRVASSSVVVVGVLYALVGVLVFLFGDQPTLWLRAGTAVAVVAVGFVWFGSLLIALVESVRDWFNRVLQPIATPWNPARERCARCTSNASYRVTVKGSEKPLCYEHANELERKMNARTPDLGAIRLLLSARNDVLEARTLDRKLQDTSQSLENIDQALDSMGVTSDLRQPDATARLEKMLSGVQTEQARTDRREQRRQRRADRKAARASKRTADRAPKATTARRPTQKSTARPAARGTAFTSDRVNINTASAAELARLPGIGPALATRIVQYRAENGRFDSRLDLALVNGVGPAKVRAILDRITT